MKIFYPAMAILVACGALQGAVTSSALDLARTSFIDDYKAKERRIFERVESRIFQTSKFTLTRSDIQKGWSLPTSYWNNFKKESCTSSGGLCAGNTGSGINLIIDTSNKQIILDNSIGSNPNAFNSEEYQKNRQNEITIDSNLRAIRPFSIKLSDMFALKEKIDASSVNVISDTSPADTSLIWYKPDGNGGYELFKYDTVSASWKSSGTLSSANGTSNQQIVVMSQSELDALPAIKGMAVMMSDGTIAQKYVYDGAQWVKASSGSSGGGVFNGTGNIEAMATTLFTKSGGSIAETLAPNSEFVGTLAFTKKDDVVTGGYWISSDNAFIVVNDINTLDALDSYFATNTTAWIPKSGGGILKLVKRTMANGVTAWAYSAVDYADVFSLIGSPAGTSAGNYVYSSKYSEFFVKNGTIFNPMSPAVTYIGAVSRGVFIATPGGQFLTNINDCDSLSCYGTSLNAYYSGGKVDGLYSFYYSPSAKNVNSLTDAKPYSNWNQFWIDSSAAVIWEGAQFGDTLSLSVLVKTTLNGQIAYDNNGKLINKLNGYYIPSNKLPVGLVSSSANIVPALGVNYVAVTGLDVFATDTSLPVSYPVSLTGSGFTSKNIQRCVDFGTSMLWSDNCLDVANSTVAITDGSRSDLSAPSSSGRINLTKQVGSEPNYTTSGVTYAGDVSWKQWFYSVTGTITNYMLDARDCPYPDGDWSVDDVCFSYQSFKIGSIVWQKADYIATHYKWCIEPIVWSNGNGLCPSQWYTKFGSSGIYKNYSLECATDIGACSDSSIYTRFNTIDSF